ncbi:hypothetical protein NB311A_17594 [Nitrobacter sp. Nb-311A]|uniref:hypothetical protein n=1 Tax=Nitrobacter sp. Nb-311A TaxID=314253 RepID=UPI000068735C|nr:hypothetical protein [Nitrobacter sp. Nb-311A]EAQ35613.1 hypothetical protein NB311A_17594 [Nitrobacter sp. Nb-311A]
MAIEDLVDDFWREALTANLTTGPQAQAKWVSFVYDLQALDKGGPPYFAYSADAPGFRWVKLKRKQKPFWPSIHFAAFAVERNGQQQSTISPPAPYSIESNGRRAMHSRPAIPATRKAANMKTFWPFSYESTPAA